MTNRILQFGTSRFLQAHVDLFVHEARNAGQDIGPITVVKTTPSNARDSRIDALNAPAGFPVHLRGFKQGQLVDETHQVTSVQRALDANRDWQELLGIFAYETEIVVSNVGETGYDLSPDDRLAQLQPPKSFPAKLHALLLHRYQANPRPLVVLPCELISNNGKVLLAIIDEISRTAGNSDGFRNWLAEHVIFCDTLVDRIVSEAIAPIGAIGEPYGLWAIKRSAGLVEPLQNPCIVYTDDLEPYLRLKLHILNLGHTFLAEIWKTENRPANETVREILQHNDVKQRLMQLYETEILPGFAARSLAEAASTYMKTTIERFENPHLNHRLSDIAQNHSYKIERRIVDFMNWAWLKNPSLQFENLKMLVEAHTHAKNTC